MKDQRVIPEATLREIYHGTAHSTKDIPTATSPIGILWVSHKVVQMLGSDEPMLPPPDSVNTDAAPSAAPPAAPRTPTAALDD